MRAAIVLTALLLASASLQAQTRGLAPSTYGGTAQSEQGCEPEDVSEEQLARMQTQVSSLMASHGSIGTGREAKADQAAITQRREELAAAAQRGQIRNPAPAQVRAVGEDAFATPLDGQATVLQNACGAANKPAGRR